jgi:hypothetical protein
MQIVKTHKSMVLIDFYQPLLGSCGGYILEHKINQSESVRKHQLWNQYPFPTFSFVQEHLYLREQQFLR